MMPYGIASSLDASASYFLFSEFNLPEKKFRYTNGALFHAPEVEFTQIEKEFIHNYFKKLNG